MTTILTWGATQNKLLEYLGLTEPQLALACSRSCLHAQVWCVLQIGYFKAKQTFFSFTREDVPADLAFVLSRYFKDEPFEPRPVTKHEHYAQRALIAKLCGYRLWTSDFLEQLQKQAAQIVRRDVTPSLVVAELITYLNLHKVERPGYTRLQRVIGEALTAERRRPAALLATGLDAPIEALLAQLLVRDDTLSELAALKQDAKDFGWRQMARHVGAAVRRCQDAAAEAGDLPAEPEPLREFGELLHDLRPAPDEGRAGEFVPAMLRVAALPAAHR